MSTPRVDMQHFSRRVTGDSSSYRTPIPPHSRIAAAVNSQGRKPLDHRPCLFVGQPRQGRPSRRLSPLPGLGTVVLLAVQGLAPLAIDDRPSGTEERADMLQDCCRADCPSRRVAHQSVYCGIFIVSPSLVDERWA